MKKLEQIYEGKAKILYSTDDPDLLIQYFKDDATAFNAQKKGTIGNKGVLNNGITTELFRLLEKEGIPTHYLEKLNDREMAVKKLSIIPIEMVVRNHIAGSLAKRMGLPEGGSLKRPIVETYYKDDALGDPMLTDEHILVFALATDQELIVMKNYSLQINRILSAFFAKLGIKLVDFKLEFGRHKGEILLGDEITPDSCRLWDVQTNEKLDKDRFRRDLGNIEEAYQRVFDLVTHA